tara:strand:+ start:243 stop:512 length:270 start_codon:yes stop_codon:yes gene_type:complete
MKIKVKQMYTRGGNPAPNQFLLYTPDGTYFQSYNHTIAFRDHNGKIQLDEDTWDYSRTTGKYRNKFLGEYIELTRDKILSGEYQLTNLN